MQFNFSDTLTEDDVKRHIPHHFDLPAHAARMRIQLYFEPATVGDLRNLVTLTLFDPIGFRGAGHRQGNDHLVEIDGSHATVGYTPGLLPSGEWTVQLDTHMILPGEPFRYELSVTAEQVEEEQIEEGQVEEENNALPSVRPTPQFDFVANPNPGWYRGDLHSHTVHSDANWDVPDLVAAAKAQKLDFIALTDHNTVSPLAEMASYADENFLTMGGQELTTFWGHALCLGAHEWLDWRVTQDGDGMASIANFLYANNQIYIVAHPKDIGDPYCTGCRWVYPGMMPGAARLVEVWNGSWRGDHVLNRDKNVAGLALWYQWLNQGLRLVATAGSDVHGPAGYARSPGFNIVHADELSQTGILRGLAAGHNYLSSGPTLTFTARSANGTQVMMGDMIAVSAQGQSVSLAASWADAPADATLRLIARGESLEQIGIGTSGTLNWTISTQEIGWCLVEVRADNGDMLALTNPIFFG